MSSLSAAQMLMAKAMSETTLQRNVVDAARLLRAKFVYHTHDSRRSESGLPDLTIITEDDRLIYWECKTEVAARRMRTWAKTRTTGRTALRSARQLEVIAAFRRTGATARVIRPRDWISGYVIAELRAPEGSVQ